MPTPPSVAATPVAAFDFDGTLTWTDSFNAFLMFVAGPVRLGLTSLAKPGPLLEYVRTRDRGALKSRFLYNVVGGLTQADLEVLIGAFVAAKGLSLFRPDALERWRALEGMTRVIVTASPELLVAPFGALIGADRVIGSRLKFDPEGRLLPQLDGLNCRGEEKMCRLRAVFGEDFVPDQAYGDTSGDAEMIAAAREGYYRLFRKTPK